MLRWLLKYTKYSVKIYRSSNFFDTKAKSKKEQNEFNYRYRNSWKSDIYQLKLTAKEAMFRWLVKYTE